MGITLGNSLRRVLLSSLQGQLLHALKLMVPFTSLQTIPGVREDVTDIILRIKQLALKAHSEEAQRVRLDVGPCVVTAGMIQETANVEVVNKDLVLFNLAADAKVSIELSVETGKGYVPAELN